MSVSVVSRDGAFADFMSTWLFIKGRSFVLERLNSFDCGLIVIDQDKNVHISENLRGACRPGRQRAAPIRLYPEDGMKSGVARRQWGFYSRFRLFCFVESALIPPPCRFRVLK